MSSISITVAPASSSIILIFLSISFPSEFILPVGKSPNLFPARLASFKSEVKLKLKSSGILSVAGSFKSTPEIISKIFAAELTEFAIGPAVSCVEDIGIIPDLLTSPTVGLIPTIPFTEEGQLTDPFVSVPIATSTNPVATTTPEPELEPHGVRISPYGFIVCPPMLDHPLVDVEERKFAHSERFVFPMTKYPLSISF